MFRAPYFPSTVEEFWVPYDMEWSLSVQRSLFIQFKVSEYLDHPRAAQKSRVACPYYRFRLHHSHGTSTQHNLLKDLSGTFPGDVFYVAPMFYTYDDYNDLCVRRNIAANSVAVDVNSMSSFTDAKRHCVAYNERQIGEFSEWKDIGKVTTLSEVMSGLLSERESPAPGFSREEQERTTAYLKKVRDTLISTLRERELIGDVPEREQYYEGPERRWFPPFEDPGAPWEGIIRVVRLASEVQRIARRYFGALWIGLA